MNKNTNKKQNNKSFNNKDDDDFWNDCLPISTTPNLTHKNINNIQHHPKHYYISKHLLPKCYIKQPKHKSTHPNKPKQAIEHCINMYNAAKTKQSLLLKKQNENSSQLSRLELLGCTWKPQINKVTKQKDHSANKKKDNIYLRTISIKYRNKYKHLLLNKVRDEGKDNEKEMNFTFHPKVNSTTDLNKVFNEINVLETKEVYEFLGRYEHARKRSVDIKNRLLIDKELEDRGILNEKVKADKTVPISVNTSFDMKKYKLTLHKQLSEENQC
jgi:hypothetical protein